VAERLAEGLSDKEIAEALGIPVATARTYVARVLRRFGAKSRRELMR
jgi:DNA-binding NarL/FixJ family response regulator